MWASAGRSRVTEERAERACLSDVGEVREVCRACDVIFSVCPPHAAADVARSAVGFDGVFVDANAVSVKTACAIADQLDRFVDGGIIGPPPQKPGTTRLYLSGSEASLVADLFGGTMIDARVVSEEPGAASAEDVVRELDEGQLGSASCGSCARPSRGGGGCVARGMADVSTPAARAVGCRRSFGCRQSWRWVAEMEEIAASYAASGLPDGFHRASAEIYQRAAAAQDHPTMERLLGEIRTHSHGR
jgi:Domain of unknown function (DUF1932)